MLTACTNCLTLNRVELGRSHPVCGKCGNELPVEGAVSELSGSALQKLAEKAPIPVVADFWAHWCGPCRVFAPIFQEVAARMTDQVVFAKVNAEANPLAVEVFKIRSIPTLILFHGGIELMRQTGAMGAEQFESWLRSGLEKVRSAA